MNQLRLAGGLVALVCACAGAAVAQNRVDPGSPHVKIPARPGQPDLEKVFAERFGRAMALDDMARILEKLYPEQSRDQLLRGLKDINIDWNDPKLRQQIADLAKHPDLENSLTPDMLEKLRQQLQAQLPELRPPMGDTDPKLPFELPRLTTPSATPPDATPVTPEVAAEDEAEEILRWLGEHLEGLAEQVEDSPALRRLLRELGEGLNADGAGQGLDQDLVAWSRWIRQARDFLEPVTSPLSEMELPRWNLGGGPMEAPSMGGAEQAAAAWPVLAWVLLVGLLVWAAWKLGAPRLPGEPGEPAWQLGGWPVPPEAIANRRQLIETYEYLSLLRFGLPAQCWNHREVARRLGHGSAQRLADLYERARYAPEDEPLSGDDLARARRDLAELARSGS